MSRSYATPLIVAAITAGAAVPAAAQLRYENGNGGSALFYGQFDPAYLTFDDGVSSTGKLVDNVNSNSRVGFWLRQPMANGEFSFNFETALGLRPSDGLSQTSTPKAIDWSRTKLRKIDFAWQTDTYGKFYVGQGSMATDGVAENDFSGTTLVTYSAISDTAGSFRFRTAAGALSGVAIKNVFPNLDGGRRGRIRYDSPTFGGGFSVAAAYGEEILTVGSNDKYTDIALRYSGEAGGVKMKGAIGFSRRDRNGVDQDDTMGSFSALFPSGFNVTVAAGSRKNSGDYTYGKVGYISNWFAVGSTAISVDYYRGSDFNSVGSTSKSLGIGAVQKFDNANVEAYLGYRDYSLSETAVAYRDASSILFGARWKF